MAGNLLLESLHIEWAYGEKENQIIDSGGADINFFGEEEHDILTTKQYTIVINSSLDHFHMRVHN